MYLEAVVVLQHLVEPKEKGEGQGGVTISPGPLLLYSGAWSQPVPVCSRERDP